MPIDYCLTNVLVVRRLVAAFPSEADRPAKRFLNRHRHYPKRRLPPKSYDVARRRDMVLRAESHGVRGKPEDDDGFTALAQLQSA